MLHRSGEWRPSTREERAHTVGKWRLPARRMAVPLLGTLFVASLMLGGVAALRWWRAPAAVADHVTASAGSLEMRLGGPSELAQWVVPSREGISVIELVLAAERPDLPGEVVVRIEALAADAERGPPGTDWPATLPSPDRRVVMREVRLGAAALPVGGAFGTGQGERAERWTPVRFEPIVPSAGRPLLVVVSYPEGRTQPGTRVATLARFPSSYPHGALYVNAFKADGTMLVRVANDETNAAAVRRVLANGAARLPLGPRSLSVVGALMVMCGILWAAVIVGIAFGGSRTRPGQAPTNLDRPPAREAPPVRP